VDEASLVQRLEPTADLARDTQGFLPGLRLSGDEGRVQRGPGHVLLDDVQLSRLRILAEVERSFEGRVDEERSTACLREEARRQGIPLALHDIGRLDDPDHDGPLALGVSGSVGDLGRAAGDLLEDHVAPEGPGDGGADHREDLRTP
jgi:hypothetical protein